MTRFLPFIVPFWIGCQDNSSVSSIPQTNLVVIDSTDIWENGIASLASLINVDEDFYGVDRSSKKIIRLSKSLSVLNRYETQGSGPGELGDPFDIAAWGDMIYVIDFSDRKIQSYTRQLEPVDELISKEPPFSLLAIDDGILLMGTMNMEFEDVYEVDFHQSSFRLDGRSSTVKYPFEGIVFHSRNTRGDLLRYRLFSNRFDILSINGTEGVYKNHTQVAHPALVENPYGPPIFKGKIHNTAFITLERACFLSGDHTESSQPMQCFSFDGTLVARYVLPKPASIAVYADSVLHTYSPENNHIYVYHLGF